MVKDNLKYFYKELRENLSRTSLVLVEPVSSSCIFSVHEIGATLPPINRNLYFKIFDFKGLHHVQTA